MPENNAIFGLLKMTKSGIARRTMKRTVWCLSFRAFTSLPRAQHSGHSTSQRWVIRFSITLSGAAGVVRSQR